MAIVATLEKVNYGEIADPDVINDNFEKLRQAVNANTQKNITTDETIKNIETNIDSISGQVMPDLNYTKTDNMFIVSKAKNSITLKAGTVIKLEISEEDVRFLEIKEDKDFNIYEIMDTGASSLTAGKDYYLYIVEKNENNSLESEIVKTVELKASQNSTYPTGYNANNSRKIGGFHTLCAAVTEANAPALPDHSIWEKHPAIGYNAGDIIPNSVWCLSNRPQSAPEGMAFVDKIDKWVDIYKQSGKEGNPTSVFGGTVVDNRQPILHQWDMELVNKKLPTDNDFNIFAEGSNQKTAIYGSAAPTPKTAGGHTDTAGKRMISGYFIEECCGYMWEWLDEIGPCGGSGFASYGTGADDRGDSYGMPYILSAGGHWDHSSSCGSRSRAANLNRSGVGRTNGGRGVSLPLRI